MIIGPDLSHLEVDK